MGWMTRMRTHICEPSKKIEILELSGEWAEHIVGIVMASAPAKVGGALIGTFSHIHARGLMAARACSPLNTSDAHPAR